MSDLHAQLLAGLRDPMYDEGLFGCLDTDTIVSSLAAALRAVVELHAPSRRISGLSGELLWIECAGCRDDAPAWPCPTIQAIARELGVDE